MTALLQQLILCLNLKQTKGLVHINLGVYSAYQGTLIHGAYQAVQIWLPCLYRRESLESDRFPHMSISTYSVRSRAKIINVHELSGISSCN